MVVSAGHPCSTHSISEFVRECACPWGGGGGRGLGGKTWGGQGQTWTRLPSLKKRAVEYLRGW